MRFCFKTVFRIKNTCQIFIYLHHAGDVTKSFCSAEKVTIKIGDAEIWWRGCRHKNRLKWQTFLFV